MDVCAWQITQICTPEENKGVYQRQSRAHEQASSTFSNQVFYVLPNLALDFSATQEGGGFLFCIYNDQDNKNHDSDKPLHWPLLAARGIKKNILDHKTHSCDREKKTWFFFYFYLLHVCVQWLKIRIKNHSHQPVSTKTSKCKTKQISAHNTKRRHTISKQWNENKKGTKFFSQ